MIINDSYYSYLEYKWQNHHLMIDTTASNKTHINNFLAISIQTVTYSLNEIIPIWDNLPFIFETTWSLIPAIALSREIWNYVMISWLIIFS